MIDVPVFMALGSRLEKHIWRLKFFLREGKESEYYNVDTQKAYNLARKKRISKSTQKLQKGVGMASLANAALNAFGFIISETGPNKYPYHGYVYRIL